MPSLYDRYKLENSTAIPLYQGSNGREGLQVAAFQQGRYDAAQQGSGDIFAGALGMKAMSKDQIHANELIGKVKGNIDEWTRRGDWENQVEGVRSLGREYSQRANELAAPIKQYQDWEKDELENKDKNLTPYQKSVKKAMAMEGYKGLKKDEYGRLVGGFDGGYVAKNIDVNAKVDEWMKGTIAAEGGSDITNDNGEWKYRNGNEWKSLSKERVQSIIANGMATDQEYLAFVKQEGEIDGYAGARTKDPSTLDAATLKTVQEYIDKGYNSKTAMELGLNASRQNSLHTSALTYGLQKYVHNNVKTVSETSLGAVGAARKIRKETADENVTTTVVPDTLGNPATRWEDLGKSQGEAVMSRDQAAQEIRKIKNNVGKITPGWNNLTSAQQEQKIKEHYDGIEGGAALYQNLNQHRNKMKAADDELRQIGEAKSFIESAVYDKLGTSKKQVSADMKAGMNSVLSDMGDQEVNYFISGVPGRSKMKASELKALLSDDKASFEVAGKSETIMPGFLEINSTSFRTKDGRTITIQDNAVMGKLDSKVSSQAKYGNVMRKEIKAYATEALKNYSQSTGVIVTNNKKINDLMIQALKGGEKTIYNVADKPLEAGKDEDLNVKAQIEAGNFDFIGTYTENKGKDGTYVKVSVKDPSDPKAIPQTYRVNLTRMQMDDVVDYYKKAAINSDGSTNTDLSGAADALLPGSAYNKINRTKLGTVAKISRRVPDGKGWKYIPIGKVEKSFIEDMPSIMLLNQNNTPLDIPGIQDNQIQIGAYLDKLKKDPNYKVE